MSEFTGTKVVAVLIANAFDSEAAKLEELLAQLLSEHEEIRKSAAREIEGYCQLQSYGNLNIKTMNGWKWNTLLEKLANHARKKAV